MTFLKLRCSHTPKRQSVLHLFYKLSSCQDGWMGRGYFQFLQSLSDMGQLILRNPFPSLHLTSTSNKGAQTAIAHKYKCKKIVKQLLAIKNNINTFLLIPLEKWSNFKGISISWVTLKLPHWTFTKLYKRFSGHKCKTVTLCVTVSNKPKYCIWLEGGSPLVDWWMLKCLHSRANFMSH